MKYLKNSGFIGRLLPTICLLSFSTAHAEDVGARWGTAEQERAYYRIVSLPIPEDLVIEGTAFEMLPDHRLAVGTRHGDIYILQGFDDEKPNPTYHLYASGLDEIFGLAYKEKAFYVTQSCELTKVSDQSFCAGQ